VVASEFLGDLAQLFPVKREIDCLTFADVDARPDNVPVLSAATVSMKDNSAGAFAKSELFLDALD
jgi:hypothetical protein